MATHVALPSSLTAADLAGLDPATLQDLLNAANRKVDATTVYFFPTSFVVYLCILYFSAKALEFSFRRYSTVFPSLSPANQRTSVVYVMNIVFTTVALAYQLAASPVLGEHYSGERFTYLYFAGAVVSGLYLFELTYRDSMRWPMILHHFSTLFSICFVIAVQTKTLHPSLAVTGLIWIFQATTEQSVFAALLMYRLRFSPRAVKFALRFASIQSFIPKFVFGVYVLVWWGLKQRMNTQPTDIAFSVILVLALVTLMFTQVYGSWIVWKISMTVEQRFKPAINDAELQDDDKTPVGSGASSLIHPSVLRKYSDSSDSGSTAA